MNRTELHRERRSTIETDFNIINDKLDDISSRLEELSKHLYEIARCDTHEYSKMFDDMMGNPMEQLDKLFEVKNYANKHK